MPFKNPLNHWRGAELKEPILAQRAILAKQVRLLLAKNPQGMTRAQINEKIPNGSTMCFYLLKRGFARVLPWNAKQNSKCEELWFISEPTTEPLTPPATKGQP